MAKRVTAICEVTGKVVTGKMPKRAKEIPWTPGPQTRAQRVKRALIG